MSIVGRGKKPQFMAAASRGSIDIPIEIHNGGTGLNWILENKRSDPIDS